MKTDKMKEKQVVPSLSFLVSLDHHGNHLLLPSCTPVYLVYSSPIHPSMPPTFIWLPSSPSFLLFESCTPLYLLHSLRPPSSKTVVIFLLSSGTDSQHQHPVRMLQYQRVSGRLLYVHPNLCLPGYASSLTPSHYMPLLPSLSVFLSGSCVFDFVDGDWRLLQWPRGEETEMHILWKISDREGKR